LEHELTPNHKEEFEDNPGSDPSRMPALFMDEDGIIREHHYDKIITKNAAMYVAEERKRRCGKDKRPLLVTFECMEGYSPDTRDMTLEIILANVSALAYHVDTTTEYGVRLKNLIDSFFSITPWPLPVKVIDSPDIQDAVDWLKQYL